MRVASLIVLAAVAVAAPSASAAATPLTFADPGQAGGEVVVQAHDGWLLLVVDAGALLELDLPGATSTVNHTHALLEQDVSGASRSASIVGLRQEPGVLDGPVRAQLRFDGPGSVFVRARAVRLELAGTSVELVATSRGDAPSGSLLPPDAGPPGVARPSAHALAQDGVAVLAATWGTPAAPAPVLVHASGLEEVEWHNATVTCATPACPSGAKRTPMPGPGGLPASVTVLPYLQAMPQGGTLAGTAKAIAVAVGGTGLDAELEGWLRLPQARRQGDACFDCLPDAAGHSLYAEGDLGLAGLHRDGDGLAADLAGLPTRTRVGEAWLATPAGAGAAAAASVLGVWLAAKAMLALAARVPRSEAAAHPLRRRLLDVTQAQPGLGLRQAFRAAGLPYATGLHHVAVLRRHGLVTLARHGRRMLLCAAGHEGLALKAAASQEDPRMRQLHDLLLLGAMAFQSDLVAHAERAWGWRPSTTRHRLGKLVQAGAVERRGVGRRIAYLAIGGPVLVGALPQDGAARAAA